MERGICRFCGQEADLIGAHIISKAIFKRLRGDGPALRLLNTWQGEAGNKSNGFVDPRLACGPCDNKFSDAENYFAEYLESHYGAPGMAFGDQTALDDKNYDYRRFKLALHAILWRAHETSNEYFADIHLDGSSARKLKALLDRGEPGDKMDFPVYVQRFRSSKHSGDALAQAICEPTMGDNGEVELVMLGWQFVIGITEDFGEGALEPGRLMAIDFTIDGQPEEDRLKRILAVSGYQPQ